MNLVIYRKESIHFLRKYKLQINQDYYWLSNNSKISIELKDIGTIRAHLDWCSSDAKTILNNEKNLVVNCRTNPIYSSALIISLVCFLISFAVDFTFLEFIGVFPIFVYLYGITFDRNKFLILDVE